jgi:hypothetical protein
MPPLPSPQTVILAAGIASAFWTFVCLANKRGDHVR